MKNINIEQTIDSPKITLNYEKGFIELDGKSYPGDAYDFYDPIVAWLKEYFNDASKNETKVNIKLRYFNSATNQIFFSILDIIKNSKSKNVTINWFYDAKNKDTYEDYEDIVEEYPELNIIACKY